MHVVPIAYWAIGLSSFVVALKLSRSITDDVNKALGTTYEKFWSTDRRLIWNQHKRLFPASRKRTRLAIALLVAFAMVWASAFLAG